MFSSDGFVQDTIIFFSKHFTAASGKKDPWQLLCIGKSEFVAELLV